MAVWHQAGAFIERPVNVAPEWLGQTMVANGFGWAAILIHNGLQVENEDQLAAGWAQRLAGQGVAVGAWAPLREDPEREAELAVELCRRHGLAFYIANAEYEYEFSGAGGGSNERAGRSGRFVTAFRAKAPDLPAALSTFGRLDQHDLDWVPWRNAGFHFLPQAYPNEDSSLGVALCTAGGAKALASPPLDLSSRTHPTIGVYPGARGLVTPEDYVAQLATEPRARGFSVYLAERMDPGWWAIYGQAIRDGRILRGAPPEPEPEPPKPEPEPEPQPEPEVPKPKPPRPGKAAAARARMIALAKEVEAEWAAQGRDPETIAASRISVARQVLETQDKTWDTVRADVRGLLAPPEEET
jgi:pyruvate/2-oxoglutarate dehydrogenase complex dihydrolipoamide acyltransferase (E2) component